MSNQTRPQRNSEADRQRLREESRASYEIYNELRRQLGLLPCRVPRPYHHHNRRIDREYR